MPDRLRERLRAAQTAADAARKVALLVVELPVAVLRDGDVGLDPVSERAQAHPLEFLALADDPFAQAEAQDEVLDVLRRRHHHDVRRAVVDERDRGLAGDLVFDGTFVAAFPAAAGKALRGAEGLGAEQARHSWRTVSGLRRTSSSTCRSEKRR